MIGIPNGAKLMLQRRRKRSLNPREGKCQTLIRLFFSNYEPYYILLCIQVPAGTDPVAWRKYCQDTVEYWQKYDEAHQGQ